MKAWPCSRPFWSAAAKAAALKAGALARLRRAPDARFKIALRLPHSIGRLAASLRLTAVRHAASPEMWVMLSFGGRVPEGQRARPARRRQGGTSALHPLRRGTACRARTSPSRATSPDEAGLRCPRRRERSLVDHSHSSRTCPARPTMISPRLRFRTAPAPGMSFRDGVDAIGYTQRVTFVAQLVFA